ncbi:MAG: hypothetical protein QY311_00545 [Candidatus Paceibacterota bacterium]|nr:MAG: hypothetical protein QY311_00545 [Candidatus Paceibacterota bacterium]
MPMKSRDALRRELKTILTQKERSLMRSLRTPERIQDFLSALPANHEIGGDSCHSPRIVMRERNAHCFEGALFAATTLWYHGHKPLLLDLQTAPHDFDHVVALFQRDGLWGAISKTNHAVLRWRDPIYRTVRELALSYFHEYFLDSGEKTLRAYSRPFSLERFGVQWVASDEPLWYIGDALDASPHEPIAPARALRRARRAEAFERAVMSREEYARTHTKDNE